MPPRSRIRRLPLVLLLVAALFLGSVTRTEAWEWSDLIGGSTPLSSQQSRSDWLTYQQVSDLRVRDIKGRLARHHGFSAEELGRMLDKKELIRSLAFEEEKLRLKADADMKRALFKQSVIIAVISVFVVICWPLFRHAWEVAHVNFVVYTDRKKLEAVRCWELQTVGGICLVIVMFGIDMLQFWLTGSILLSWVMRSKYFFPVPNIPIRPAQLMGGQMAQTSLASYGINVGPMFISWALRFLNGRVQYMTGKAMVKAQKAQRKASRMYETAEEKATRRTARRQAKREAQERAAAQAAAAAAASAPPPPAEWAAAAAGRSGSPTPQPADSQAHADFLRESENHSPMPDFDDDEGNEGDEPLSGFDELD